MRVILCAAIILTAACAPRRHRRPTWRRSARRSSRAIPRGKRVPRAATSRRSSRTGAMTRSSIPPGQAPIEGKAALRAYITETMKIPGFKITWKSEKPTFSPDGKFAYLRGTNAVTMQGPNAKPMEMDGRGITDLAARSRRPMAMHDRHLERGAAAGPAAEGEVTSAPRDSLENSRLLMCSLGACAKAPEAPKPPSPVGSWTVVSHSAPGISAMNDSVAESWIGRTAQYRPNGAIFLEDTCVRAQYPVKRVMADSFFQSGFNFDADKLGFNGDSSDVGHQCLVRPRRLEIGGRAAHVAARRYDVHGVGRRILRVVAQSAKP